jgi:hypothetical protein
MMLLAALWLRLGVYFLTGVLAYLSFKHWQAGIKH